MKELEIFGKIHKYDYEYDIKNDINVIEELSKGIKKSQILDYRSFFPDAPVHIYIEGYHGSICDDCIYWMYQQNKIKTNDESIWNCLLRLSIEDKEWTEWRNKDLTGTFYRKITFVPEIQNAVCEKLNEYTDSLNTILEEYLIEKQQKKEEIERQKNEWKVSKVFKDIHPTYGENGRDGYIDAEYISQNGDIVRMVERDVFDVGTYSYPKRLEGNEDAFKRELWTEAEKTLAIWLAKFGEFKGIRM